MVQNGKPLGQMVIELGLDSTAFSSSLTGATRAAKTAVREMGNGFKVLDSGGNKLDALSYKQQALTKVISAQKNELGYLKQAYDKTLDSQGNATSKTAAAAQKYNDAQARLAGYKQELISTAGSLAELQVKTTGATGAILAGSEKMISAGKGMESVGAGMTKGLTVPIIAGAAAVTTAAISWESAFAGVKKTNDEVVDTNGKVVYSYKDLENGLRGLAKELPSSHQEIAAVAEAAGQLGIETPNVVGFTKTMIDLGESTNMSAETAATALARFANITQMSQTDFDRLGAVIVDLGNNFATTESEITEMGLRLAGAGKQIGMSEGEIMGFAAALSSVGIEAEAGGSAFSKVMVQMQLAVEKGTGAFTDLEEMASNAGTSMEDIGQAVANGGKPLKVMAENLGMTSKQLSEMYKEADKSKTSLESFATVAGMTGEEFSKAFKDDPSQAIIKFIEGLKNAESQGTSAIKVLDDMGITEVRLRDSLLRASNASNVFSGAVEMGNRAWSENTALTEEANKRYETTESKLKMLKNEVVDSAIELGGPFVDALRDGLQASKPLVKMLGDLAKAFSDADPITQRMIVSLLATTAAAGPLLSITGKLTGGIGSLGKSFVELSASMAKKKAITETTEALTSGAISTKQFSSAMANGVGNVTKFGSAAASASGVSGIGAMSAALGPLGPAILGIVGVGGALAVGYGAWKLFGEEAWNSSQRVQRWGSDVGEATDKALTKVQSNTQLANGEFVLLEKGVSQNTESVVNNFAKMGQSIEDNMIKRIELLKKMVNDLPSDVQKEGNERVQQEIVEQEKRLKIVQENNEKINQIKQNASNNNRKISYEETAIVKSLAEESANSYVQSLGKSEKETKDILTAMTGNVENASKEQAEQWLQSLGKQRQQSKLEYSQMREDLEKQLIDGGYDLNSKFAKDMLNLLEESSKSASQITEDQMSTILAKYPELANEVFLANGQLISSMGDASQAAVAENKKLMESFGDMSATAAKSAEENAKKIDLISDKANEFGEFWNGLVLDKKTGEIKTNAQEEVTKAAESESGWNKLLFASKNADLSSNAKLMIAEAGIANGKWEKMTFTEQQALLESNATKTITQALQAKAKWQGLNFEQKKAVLYSNTPEVMSETLLNLGLWQEFQPEIKELDADNKEFLNILSGSTDKIVQWSEVPVDVKKIIGDNYDFLEKVYQSEVSFTAWKNLPNDEKKLLVNNTDVLTKLLNSQEHMQRWNTLPVEQKQLLADNTDLMSKVFASEQSYNAWIQLPDNVKRMLADNVDLNTKLADGSLSLETYKQIDPGLKILMGDAYNVVNASSVAESSLNSYRANNPGMKFLTGEASSVVGASNQGNSSLNSFSANNPLAKHLSAIDEASNPASIAKEAVWSFNSLPNIITKTLRVATENALGHEKGTNYHPGGPAIVNDQSGPLYEELVIPKGGTPFIAKGRDVLLPDLPRGSKVLNARQTKRVIPKYAEGIGVPENSTVVRNLKNYSTQTTEVINQGVYQTEDYTRKFDELISIMSRFGSDLSNLRIEVDRKILGDVVIAEQSRRNRAGSRSRGERL